MEPIDHPPGHEIERLNREIEGQYGEEDMNPWDPPHRVTPLQETAGPEPGGDPITSQPDLTGTEMMERDPSLTGADVLEIKMGIRPYETDDTDRPL